MQKFGEKMKNYKISKKLTISYAVVLILLVISIVVSIVNLVSIGNQVETFYNGPFTVAARANIINAKFEEMQKSVYRSISNSDANIANKAITNANDCAAVIQEQLPVIKEHFLGDQAIVESLQEKLTELAPMREEVLKLSAEDHNTEAAAYMEENNIPVIAEAQEYLSTLIATAQTTGETLITTLNQKQTTAVIILSILGVASVLISVAFAKYITGSITKPVSEIELAVENLSQGKLDSNIEYESEDELGKLAAGMRFTMTALHNLIADLSYLMTEIAEGNFNVKTKDEKAYMGEFLPLLLAMREMNTNLSDTISQINDSSDQVAIGSTQMAENAQSLAEGATEQAGAVEELNATIDDVATTAEKSANDTEQAYEMIRVSADKAEGSRHEMEKLIEAMERINATSQEIGNIIVAIEDIASQTNLLSLNASIEAARAGEAGRGFAVVANQIGKLASDSAQSAASTRELIEKTLKEIEVGNEITEKTSESFQEVIEAMQKFAGIAKDTSEKSFEQSGSLKQVLEGIEQISSVVQSNSASAEEASATSEELAAQADNLKTLMCRFQLKQA